MDIPSADAYIGPQFLFGGVFHSSDGFLGCIRGFFSGIRNDLRIIKTFANKTQLPHEQTDLKGRSTEQQEGKKSGQAGVFDERIVGRVFLFAVLCIVSGFFFVLVGSYLTFHKHRIFLGPALFGLGLVLPGTGLLFWWLV